MIRSTRVHRRLSGLAVGASLIAMGVAAASPSATAPPSILGAWEVCGSSPASAEQLDPRGTPGIKMLFTADGRRFVQLPQLAMVDSGTLFAGNYAYAGGALSWRNGDEVIRFQITAVDPDTLAARGDERTLLYCRLGADQAAFDRPLPPQSIDYLRTERQPSGTAIRNPKRATPPHETLTGTWELVRVIARRGPESLPAYGLPTIRVTIDHNRLCTLHADFTGDAVPECTRIALRGRRVALQGGSDKSNRLAGLFDTGQPLDLDSFGNLLLENRGSTYHFAWVGPGTDSRTSFPTRLVLFDFID
jgi:hypothetical protein